MLASLDAATPEADIRPRAARSRRVRAHRRDGGAGSCTGCCSPRSTRSIRRTTSSSPRAPPPRRCTGSRPMSRRRSRARAAAAPAQQILSRSTVSAVEFRLQFAGQHRAQQQRADAGRSGQGNAAADAEILARRQPAGTGGADRQGRDRAGFARALISPPAACAGARRQQQPGRHRRDAGEPRRGDAGGRHPAGAARSRCVRSHR